MKLRDHSQTCEHGEYKHHRPGAIWVCQRHMCPGGREITIKVGKGMSQLWRDTGLIVDTEEMESAIFAALGIKEGP